MTATEQQLIDELKAIGAEMLSAAEAVSDGDGSGGSAEGRRVIELEPTATIGLRPTRRPRGLAAVAGCLLLVAALGWLTLGGGTAGPGVRADHATTPSEGAAVTAEADPTAETADDAAAEEAAAREAEAMAAEAEAEAARTAAAEAGAAPTMTPEEQAATFARLAEALIPGWTLYGGPMGDTPGFIRDADQLARDPLAQLAGLSDGRIPIYDTPNGQLIGYHFPNLGFVDLETVNAPGFHISQIEPWWCTEAYFPEADGECPTSLPPAEPQGSPPPAGG